MMAIELSNEERETHLSLSAADRGAWVVFSDDPVMIRKLENMGAILNRVAADGLGRFYTLPANQISFRRPPKPLSDARKAQLAKQMRALRNP